MPSPDTGIQSARPDGGPAQVKVPYLSDVELLSEFTNAKVNACYELVSGSRIETVFNNDPNAILDVDDIIGDMKDLFGKLDPFLANYSGTPEEIQTIQNTLLPLLEPYEDMEQVAALKQKLTALAGACQGGTTSPECQAALTQVRDSYAALQEVVDDLPPFPEFLLPGVAPSANGRVAAGEIPNVTKTELDAYAQSCGTPICKTEGANDKITRYYGQIHGPGDQFWLVKEGTKKWYVWRGYILDQEIYGYCPVGSREYTVFYPATGQTAGEAFSNMASQFVFDVGVTVITGGVGLGGSVSEAVVADVAGAVIGALDESQGDPDKFVSALKTELIFTTLALSPEGAAAIKKLYKKAAPNFEVFRVEAKKWNEINT